MDKTFILITNPSIWCSWWSNVTTNSNILTEIISTIKKTVNRWEFPFRVRCGKALWMNIFGLGVSNYGMGITTIITTFP
jgi:hypothetical protein